ncbi:hypothetical protein ACA910_010112 [Epithemia clementina (nom. ined.)]
MNHLTIEDSLILVLTCIFLKTQSLFPTTSHDHRNTTRLEQNATRIGAVFGRPQRRKCKGLDCEIACLEEIGFGQDHAMDALEHMQSNCIEVAIEYALTHLLDPAMAA